MTTTVGTSTRGPGPGTRVPRRQAPPRPAPPRPGRPGVPGRRGLSARGTPGLAPTPGPAPTPGTGRRPASRTPFILLVLALLGCGLVCLLVINTTLAAASFRISNLQRENTEAAHRVQELQQQVSADRSANSIEQRALRLGMRTQPTLDFLDLNTGRRYTMPARVPGVRAVPGYTP